MERVRVVIEAPRGSFVKRRADGQVDYVSPLPVPFNYGSLPGTVGGDGDPVDAIVLGATLPAHEVVEVEVFGVVRFLDGGLPDDKLVCAARPPTAADWHLVRGFFVTFSHAKQLLNRVRRRHGVTRLVTIERFGPEGGTRT